MGRVITQADVDAYHAALGKTGGGGGHGTTKGGAAIPSTRGLDNIDPLIDIYFFAKESTLMGKDQYQCKWCFEMIKISDLKHNRVKDKRALPAGVYVCPSCKNLVSVLQYKHKKKVTKER